MPQRCDSFGYTNVWFLYRIIYGYFEIAAKEGDMAGLKGMITG